MKLTPTQAQLLDLDELPEVTCQAKRHDAGCSQRAYYMVIAECDDSRIFWCKNRHAKHLREAGEILCDGCHRDAEICWTPVQI